MPVLLTEYYLKGIFLGLLLFISLKVNDQKALLFCGSSLTIGLIAGLVLSIVRHWKELKRFGSKWFAYLLYLLLENPLLIYSGIVLGAAYAAFTLPPLVLAGEDNGRVLAEQKLIYYVLAGAVLGLGMGLLRSLPAAPIRVVLAFLLAVGLTWGVLYWLNEGQFLGDAEREAYLGGVLLLGVPFFYLLIFSGESEESEAEFAALCAVLAVALHLLLRNLPKKGPLPLANGIWFCVPVLLYGIYAIRVLPGLRVFKHTLRGYSYLELQEMRRSLQSFRRAIQYDPANELARKGLWKLHSIIRPEQVAGDAETARLLDPNLCYERIARLAVRQTPDKDQLSECQRLLDLLDSIAPDQQPKSTYYRAILALHQRQTEQASGLLTQLLNPASWQAELNDSRREILFSAWQLALIVHPKMKEDVGQPQLQIPGRRVEAIQAVERELSANPQDGNAQSLKSSLYDGLTLRDFASDFPPKYLPDFDYEYAARLGLPLLQDSVRWERGAELVQIAISGLPQNSPDLYEKLIESAEKQGLPSKAQQFRQQAREFIWGIGVERLTEDQRSRFYQIVQDNAQKSKELENWEEVIACLSIYTRYEKSGVETLRQLAEAYEKKKDVLNALRVNEKALLYSKADKDLLARKDRYYYSLEPAKLKEIVEEVRTYLDVDYCLEKGKQLLDDKQGDVEILDWAFHLVQLARVMRPNDLLVKVQEARCRLRRGETEEALSLLEDVRLMKPKGSEETDWWYFTQKQLAKLYLDELGHPEMAIPCLRDYQQSPKSGADTIFELGRAYEATGQINQAMKCFETVTGYTEHPRRWDAEDALRRLRSN